MVMKKKIFTAAILMSFLTAQALPAYCAGKMTRKQKKEMVLINAAATSFKDKQYEISIEFYTKAIQLNNENPYSYTGRCNA